LKDTTITYGVDFFLSTEWDTLTQTLGLDTSMQTYLIWLWLDSAYTMSYSRLQDGGNPQYGIIAGMGSEAFYETMMTMQYELPMFIWSSQFNISYAANVTSSSQDCMSFYTNILGWTTSANNLCNNDAFGWFNFTNDQTNNNGYFLSALALTSIYLYHEDSPYYIGFTITSGMAGNSIWATGSNL